jgi:hypothetical protein
MKPLFDHMLCHTCKKLREKNISFSDSQYIYHPDLQTLINYWMIYFSLGHVVYTNRKFAWHKYSHCNNLTGNKFIKDIMGLKNYQLLDRYMSADLKYVRPKGPVLCKRFWSLYPNLSLDDQLWKCLCRGSGRIHNPKKRDLTNIRSYELCDELYYAWEWFFTKEYEGRK